MQSEIMGKTLAMIMVIAMIATVAVTMLPTVAAGDTQIIGTVKSSVTFNPIDNVKVDYFGLDTGSKSTVYTESGNFVLGVQYGIPENYTLNFTIDGFQPRIPYVVDNTSFVSGESDAGTIYLTPKSIVEGTVYELDSETKINGVEITIDDGGVVETETVDGMFSSFTGEDYVDIYFNKFGYYLTSVKHVKVADISNEDIYYMEKITPTPTILVSGVVYGIDLTDGIEGAHVSISEGDDKWITAICDEDGSYEMYAYPGNYQIKASADTFLTTFDETRFFTVSNDKSSREDVHLEQLVQKVNLMVD